MLKVKKSRTPAEDPYAGARGDTSTCRRVYMLTLQLKLKTEALSPHEIATHAEETERMLDAHHRNGLLGQSSWDRKV